VAALPKDPNCEKLKVTYTFCFGMRHEENDWSQPSTVEKAVLANRYGFLFSDVDLLNGQEMMELSREEAEEIRDAAENFEKCEHGALLLDDNWRKEARVKDGIIVPSTCNECGLKFEEYYGDPCVVDKATGETVEGLLNDF